MGKVRSKEIRLDFPPYMHLKRSFVPNQVSVHTGNTFSEQRAHSGMSLQA